MSYRCLTLFALIITCGTLSASAEPKPLREARKALREGLPQVAAHKLRVALIGAELSQEDRGSANRLLVEALVSAGQFDEALKRLEQMDDDHPDTILLRGRALAGLGKWEEALPVFRSLSALSQAPLAAHLGEAESLAALGRDKDAAGVLQALVDAGKARPAELLRLAGLYAGLNNPERARQILKKAVPGTPAEAKWRTYVEGRIYLAEQHPLPARELFEQLLREPEHLTESLLFGGTLGLTDATIALSGYESARGALESFIQRFPQSAYLEEAFRRLDQIYSQEEDPSESQLHKWAQQPPARRAALATFYVARLTLRERKFDKTAVLLKHFFQTYTRHPLLCDAYLMQADMYLAQRQLTDAIPVLEAAMRHASSAEQRGEIELRTAIVHHQQGEYLLAANLFRSAADRSPALRTVATYNGALAWLNLRSEVPYAAELRRLGEQPQGAALQSELLLEQGLLQARLGEFRAEETLQLFLQQNSRHRRAGEARIALAELQFQAARASANPQRQAEAVYQAAHYLRVANTEPRTPEMAEQADYLAVFLADTGKRGNDARVIELGLEFLRRYSKSRYVSDIRMKLGQVYFRTEDLANAETQFAMLAEESPDSQYAETALFLAGQSAMGLAQNPGALDRALVYFDRVVQRDGPLKLYARQEQAIAQRRMRRDDEAIILYDLILTAQPSAGPELRHAALCGKGDSLRELGRKDAAKLEAAVTVFDELAAAPNVTPLWRNQALYKKAKTLEQLGRTAEALTAFYDVLERSNSADREHFWSAKAGFDAGKILEQKEQWKPAIAIYEKLAKLEGPRAAEARDRVKDIRLKHFVWD